MRGRALECLRKDIIKSGLQFLVKVWQSRTLLRSICIKSHFIIFINSTILFEFFCTNFLRVCGIGFSAPKPICNGQGSEYVGFSVSNSMVEISRWFEFTWSHNSIYSCSFPAKVNALPNVIGDHGFWSV